MKKQWFALPALAGASLLLASCYPGEVTSVQQLDVVVTAHDDTVTFTSFETYALLDSVVHIDLEDNANDDLLSRDNDQLIIDQVRAGIEAMGYIEEMNPGTTTPDVIVLIGAYAVENSAYISYPWWPWYSWGYPPGYPCCGPGYGWGYPIGGTVTWAQGTLAISMLDPSRLGTEMEAPVLWVAGINGLLEGSAAGLTVRITNLIDQAFDQSPYLSVN